MSSAQKQLQQTNSKLKHQDLHKKTKEGAAGFSNQVKQSKENKDSSNHNRKQIAANYNEMNNNNYNQQKKQVEQQILSEHKLTKQMYNPQNPNHQQQYMRQMPYNIGGAPPMGALQQIQPPIPIIPGQQQQLMTPREYLDTFRQGLRVISKPDGAMIQELTNYAKFCHGQYSRQIVDSIFERIRSVSQNKLIIIYILDSILKNVQGDYIRLFQSRIMEIFEDAFSSPNLGEKRSLIKMFKTWDLFFQPNLLENIAHRCQLNEYEDRLLSAEDRDKVNRFRREFEPRNLPDEVMRNGQFIAGSESQMNAQRINNGRDMFNQGQFLNQIGGMNYPVGGGQPNNQQHLQMPGQNFNPPESNQPGMIPLGGNQGGGQQQNLMMSTNITQNTIERDLRTQQNYNQPSNLASIFERLGALNQKRVDNQGSDQMVQPHGLHQLPANQQFQHQQQPQYQIDQFSQAIGSSNRANGQGYLGGIVVGGIEEGKSHIQHQQNHIQGARGHQIIQYSNGSGSYGGSGLVGQPHGGVMSRGGQMYTKTHIDDNFQNKTNVDHTQFGFLPSILKSFQQFKTNHMLILGQDSRLSMQGSTRPPSFDNINSLKELNFLAINEVYEGVKFQCAICGMRFIRNQILKKHLDMHFNKNNEFRRRGNRAVSRPQFMNEKEFVQPRAQQQNQKAGGQSGNQNQKITDDMVPYNNRETACFICKEVFDVVFDDEEEAWYFMSAKKIRLNTKENKKSTIVVHSDCMKQIELNRELQKQLKDSAVVQNGHPDKLTVQRSASTNLSNPGIQVITQEDKNQNLQLYNHTSGTKNCNEIENHSSSKQYEGDSELINGNTHGDVIYQQLKERVDLEALEKQIRGIKSSKRQFLGI